MGTKRKQAIGLYYVYTMLVVIAILVLAYKS
jgi:hypothetical protein